MAEEYTGRVCWVVDPDTNKGKYVSMPEADCTDICRAPALIDGRRARLYAGAGIVAGSDPDKELAEIQLKLRALLKALV